jgi:hypothetical protein
MGDMEKTTITILVVVSIAILVGSVCGIIQINKASAQGPECATTWSKKCEDDSQLAMQKQDCLRLKADMATDQAAAKLYASKNCDGLLK